MKTKQHSVINNVRKISLLCAIAMLLLVAALVLINRPSVIRDLFPDRPPDLQKNPFSAEDFTYKNGYMTCLTAESWLGVDVSHHQGAIRWDEVADAGVRFAMIRLGHRAVSDGVVRLDQYWEKNIQGAKDAGLLVGVYFYSQAVSVEEAREEAAFVLEHLKGISLDFPVVFDWEVYSSSGRNAHVDADILNACAIAFCEMIESAGYQPMIYFNLDLANRLWDLERMQQQGYPFWLALYRDKMNWEYRPDIWQYTETGKVAGIDTPVDLNLFFIYE